MTYSNDGLSEPIETRLYFIVQIQKFNEEDWLNWTPKRGLPPNGRYRLEIDAIEEAIRAKESVPFVAQSRVLRVTEQYDLIFGATLIEKKTGKSKRPANPTIKPRRKR